MLANMMATEMAWSFMTEIILEEFVLVVLVVLVFGMLWLQ